MKCIFSFKLVFWFSVIVTVAQPRNREVDIRWGETVRVSRSSTLEDIIGYDSDGVYTIRKSESMYANSILNLSSFKAIERYDHNMNLVRSVEVDLRHENHRKRRFEQVILYHGKLLLFTSFPNKDKKQNQLFVQEVDKETLFAEKKLHAVATINYEGHSRYNSGTFDYTISRDSSKLLIFYQLPYEKEEIERFGFHVFDNKFDLLWEKQITLNYQEELFDIAQYRVDNQGDIHILGKLFDKKRKEKRKGEANYKYQILSYWNKGEELVEYPVEMSGIYLNNMRITIDDNQNIVCAGFYSEEGSNGMKGSYFLTIDKKSREVVKKTHKAFSADFMAQGMKKRQAKKTKNKMAKDKDVELFNYNLNELILRDDGGAVLVSERAYTKQIQRSSTDGMPNGRSYTRYYYHNIAVVSLNSAGVIDWAQKIPKWQITDRDGGFYSSYAIAVINDKLHFIYNDHPKNLDAKSSKIHNFSLKRNKAIVVMVTIDSQGKQKKQSLFLAADAQTITRPKVCEQISDTELIVFGQRKKKQRLAKLSFGKSRQLSNR
ncbi:MAG: hypothetical protein WBA23_00315 [Tunicatimonas sp.]|uniref:hypothetical protein n=1 Tax=Tunicatimonas sp. TaxID=1940096 RepID=UPI003C73F4AD